jgi:hypothetical protein
VVTAFLAVCQRHWAASVAAEDYMYQHRHLPAQTGRLKTDNDRLELFYGVIDTHFVFYDVFDKNFQKIISFGPFNTTWVSITP